MGGGIASKVVHAAPAISTWIAHHVKQPIVIGPDQESEQWVAAVAGMAGCPYAVFQKKRSGDRTVSMSIPDMSAWAGMTPVLIDDIVSTARTMIAASAQIRSAGMPPPVCIAVHPLFTDDAYAALHAAGVERIVSCNTVEHATNRINVCQPIALAVGDLLSARYAA